MKFINSKKSVLVIDYRSGKEEESMSYQNLSIAQVPSNVLTLGYDQFMFLTINFRCIFSGLVKTVPVAERGKLNRLSDYDLVVLMDASSPPTYRNGELVKDSSSAILMNALTAYNTISQPRRRPLFLDGGFENWKYHYPMYVSAETHRRHSLLDPNSQFAELLNQIRAESKIAHIDENLLVMPQVEYPDLYEVKKPIFYMDEQPVKREPSPSIPQPAPRKSMSASSSESKIYPPPTPNTLYPRTNSPKPCEKEKL